MELTPVNPIIAGVEITTDNEGRFNLNSLHRASGEGEGKAPSKWFRNAQVQDLVSELVAQTGQICTVSTEGRNGGTFAHELLAVSYAGWISPAFQLKVNQVFIDYRSGRLQPVQFAIPQTLPEALRLAADLAEEVSHQKERLAITEPKAEALDRIANADGLTSMTVAAKLIGMPPRKFIHHLHAHQWIYRSGNGWVGREDRVRQGLIDHKYHPYIGSDGHERQRPQVYLTPKGVAKLTMLLGQGAA